MKHELIIRRRLTFELSAFKSCGNNMKTKMTNQSLEIASSSLPHSRVSFFKFASNFSNILPKSNHLQITVLKTESLYIPRNYTHSKLNISGSNTFLKWIPVLIWYFRYLTRELPASLSKRNVDSIKNSSFTRSLSLISGILNSQ